MNFRCYVSLPEGTSKWDPIIQEVTFTHSFDVFFFFRKFLRDGSLGILCWCECVHHYTLTASFEWIFLGNLTWAIFLVCQRLHHFGCATNCHVSVRKRRSSFVFWVFMGYLCQFLIGSITRLLNQSQSRLRNKILKMVTLGPYHL